MFLRMQRINYRRLIYSLFYSRHGCLVHKTASDNYYPSSVSFYLHAMNLKWTLLYQQNFFSSQSLLHLPYKTFLADVVPVNRLNLETSNEILVLVNLCIIFHRSNLSLHNLQIQLFK